jgi:hypothetical protein
MQVWIVEILTGAYEEFQAIVVGVFSSQSGAEAFIAKKTVELECAQLNELGDNRRAHEDQYRWSYEIQNRFGCVIASMGARYHLSGPFTVDENVCH